jgi:hypothetical protein
MDLAKNLFQTTSKNSGQLQILSALCVILALLLGL